MNQLYPKARQAFASKELDWNTDVFRAAMVYDSYLFRETDVNLSDLGVFVAARSEPLSSKSTVDGFCDGDNILFTNAAGSQPVGKVVIYKDTGDDTTSLLVAYYDDIVGLPAVVSGGSYYAWVDRAFGGLFRL